MRIRGAGVMLHLPERQCVARFLVAVVVRVGCRGRERGRVLAYVRATAARGDAEVHAQQQALATHRERPLKLSDSVSTHITKRANSITYKHRIGALNPTQ